MAMSGSGDLDILLRAAASPERDPAFPAAHIALAGTLTAGRQYLR